MGLPALINLHRDEILRVCARHGVGRVWVFGSVARGDARPDSDVDFMIKRSGALTNELRDKVRREALPL